MYNNNTLLSYSIEPTCRRIPKPNSKPARPQAYLLAKQETYFYAPRFSWTIPFLGELRERLGIDMVVGMHNDNATIREELEELGIPNHGRLPKLDFFRKLGESFVLVGVGQPRISPSPWDGLCMGVPVSRRRSIYISYIKKSSAGADSSSSTRSWNGTREARTTALAGSPNNGV